MSRFYSPQECRRKANQHWEMAGLARKHADLARQWDRLAREGATTMMTMCIKELVSMQTKDMWLVYEDSEGKRHYQPYMDVVFSGTLVDTSTDEDMHLIGWTTELPQ